jgi:hypothetical protein
VHDATLINPLVAASPEWQNYRALSPDLNPAPSVSLTRPGETDPQAALAKVLRGEALPDPRFDLTTTLCKLRDLFSRH